MTCFALLDDRNASAARPTSRLYTGFVREHRCTDPATLDETWAAAENDLRKGLHAVVLADYEWGAKLLRAGYAALPPGDTSSLRLLMFERLAKLSKQQTDAWLQVLDQAPGRPKPGGAPSGGRSEATWGSHDRAPGRPKPGGAPSGGRSEATWGSHDQAPGSAVRHVLSCSPELFLRHDGGLLTARPMKGTAPRARTTEGDSEMARWLAEDMKNRAENLMIVDLLRNDLGRIARVGSVRVPNLFTIETHPTLFQMTSTVQARLASELSFADLLRATFPCGSITGAPKHHTMELIAELESTPRGLYTGAIGWVDAPPDDARCGDFCLSVAIRTLTLGESH